MPGLGVGGHEGCRSRAQTPGYEMSWPGVSNAQRSMGATVNTAAQQASKLPREKTVSVLTTHTRRGNDVMGWSC